MKKRKNRRRKTGTNPRSLPLLLNVLKAQADALLAKYRFSEAESLMTEGAKRDPSVLYYEDFMNRLKEVVTIDKSK